MPHWHDSINMCVHILVCVKHVHIHVCPPVSAGFAFMNLNRYKSKVFFLENSFIMNTQALFLLFPAQQYNSYWHDINSVFSTEGTLGRI